MRKLRLKLVLVSLFVVVLTNTFYSHSIIASKSVEKNILVIHSYHKGFKWTDDITQGIEDVLSDSNHSFNLMYEYMDTKRTFSKEYFSSV